MMFTESFEFPLFLLAIFSNIVLAVVVWLYAGKNSIKNFFVLFVAVQTAWAGVNFLSFVAIGHNYFLDVVRFVMFLAVLHSYFFILFINAFTFSERVHHFRYAMWLFSLGALVVAFLTLSPYVFSGLDHNGLPIPGPAIPVFGLFTVGSLLGGLIILVWKYNKEQSLKKRRQALYLLIGLILTILFVLLLAFIGYIRFRNVDLVRFSHLYTLPFVIFTAYAIVKHSFLNLRPILAEAGVILLIFVLFFDLLNSRDANQLTINSVVFLGALSMGILVVRGVKQEINQREKIEEIARELTDANLHLREMDQMKSEFVSIASHQLRAPLTAIKGYASMLIEGSYGKLPEKTTEPVGRIMQSAENLIAIIEDFLDLSCIEQGKLSYQFATVDIAKLAREVFQEFEPRAKEKGLGLSFFADSGGGCFAIADEGKMRQIISNLADNAIKYTPKGSVQIRIRNNHETGKLTLSVEDTGIGIAPGDMPHLFQRFSRGSKKSGRKLYTEGTGFGLYVAKSMIEAHRGRIWAESEGSGKGAKFSIELNAEQNP